MVIVPSNIWRGIFSSHSFPVGAWVLTGWTSSGTVSRASPSDLPPSTTSASSSARPSSMASHTSRTTTLCTDQVSSYPTCKSETDLKASPSRFALSSPQWVTSWMCIWTAVDLCRLWRERAWCWTAQPPGSWTPESTSPGTFLERSELH